LYEAILRPDFALNLSAFVSLANHVAAFTAPYHVGGDRETELLSAALSAVFALKPRT
jgi:hypothetical protein